MKKFTEWMNLTEGMNDYAKDMDVKEKIKKYCVTIDIDIYGICKIHDSTSR